MFLNAIMLAGIGGAVVPLVLHLLHRYRFRTVQWGAMMFLLGDDPRQTRRNRLKQLILLLVRMALVALLAICLARPVVRGAWAPASPAPASVVILLDRSPAMGYPENRQPRLALARQAATTILSTLHSGDEVTLITLGDAPPGEAPVATTDLAALAGRVQSLAVGPAAANIADGLNRAAEILSTSGRINQRVYIVCGHEASSWKQVDPAFCKAWLARWPGAPKGIVALVGSDQSENVAVTDIKLLHPPALRRRPMEAEATIHDFGPAPHSHLQVQFRVGGKTVATQTVSVAPGAETVARQVVEFPDAGSHVLVAQIAPPIGIAGDSSAQVSLDVMDSLPVMILGKEGNLISLALAPFHAVGRAGPDLAVADVFDAADPAWASKLQDYCVIILADEPLLLPQQVQVLEQWVYDGGGLLIAPGEHVRAADYNDFLYKDGAGLMPARLDGPTPADGSGSTTLGSLDRTHPVFDFLRDKPDFVPSAVIRRFFPAAVASSGRILATYARGQPFLIAATYGKGRVLLTTTPLDESWGSLPLDSFFLPFVQSAVAYLASQPSQRNLDLGQPLVATFDAPGQPKTARLTRPGLPTIDVPASRVGDKIEYRYQPDQAGEYDLTARTQVHFVVRRPADVSDLTPLSGDRITELSGELGMPFIDASAGDLVSAVAPETRQRELWPWLLGMVLTLAVAEVALARIWTVENR